MRTVLTIALVLLALPLEALAYQQPETRPLVRVDVPDPFEGTVTRRGTVEGVVGDTIRVRVGRRVLNLDIDDADPHVALPGNAGKAGAGLGMTIGLITGAVVGYFTYEPDYHDVTRCRQRPGAMMWSLYGATCRTIGQEDRGWRPGRAIMGGGLGALSGALLGYVVGSTARDWIPFEDAALQVAPDGVSVSVRR